MGIQPGQEGGGRYLLPFPMRLHGEGLGHRLCLVAHIRNSNIQLLLETRIDLV